MVLETCYGTLEIVRSTTTTTQTTSEHDFIVFNKQKLADITACELLLWIYTVFQKKVHPFAFRNN